MELFFKGIIAGIGGASPGLSGCVLLIIFGLYQRTLEALGALGRDFRRSIRFLFPLLLGMGVGVLLFSRVLEYLLTFWEVPTRFTFLGLILGTIPLFYKEVRKNGFSARYYLLILLSSALGFAFFTANADGFPPVLDPSLPQCLFLGVVVAVTAIVPGLDPAVLLSTLGLYELYVTSLAQLRLPVLLPMLIGVVCGAVVVSSLMNALLRRFYTATFCVVFGLFLSMIPNILTPRCTLRADGASLLSLLLLALGFVLSYLLGDWERFSQKWTIALKRRKNR